MRPIHCRPSAPKCDHCRRVVADAKKRAEAIVATVRAEIDAAVEDLDSARGQSSPQEVVAQVIAAAREVDAAQGRSGNPYVRARHRLHQAIEQLDNMEREMGLRK
ncbi:MAG TPA: hypothetical protein VGI39_01395 [Polyangiaceae bacterium]